VDYKTGYAVSDRYIHADPWQFLVNK